MSLKTDPGILKSPSDMGGLQPMRRRGSDSLKVIAGRKKKPDPKVKEDEDYPLGGEWRCVTCGVKAHETPLKRRGPDGKRNICNACYVRMRVKTERAERGTARPIIPPGGLSSIKTSLSTIPQLSNNSGGSWNQYILGPTSPYSYSNGYSTSISPSFMQNYHASPYIYSSRNTDGFQSPHCDLSSTAWTSDTTIVEVGVQEDPLSNGQIQLSQPCEQAYGLTQMDSMYYNSFSQEMNPSYNHPQFAASRAQQIDDQYSMLNYNEINCGNQGQNDSHHSIPYPYFSESRNFQTEYPNISNYYNDQQVRWQNNLEAQQGDQLHSQISESSPVAYCATFDQHGSKLPSPIQIHPQSYQNQDFYAQQFSVSESESNNFPIFTSNSTQNQYYQNTDIQQFEQQYSTIYSESSLNPAYQAVIESQMEYSSVQGSEVPGNEIKDSSESDIYFGPEFVSNSGATHIQNEDPNSGCNVNLGNSGGNVNLSRPDKNGTFWGEIFDTLSGEQLLTENELIKFAADYSNSH
ncbi:hypothetical protein HK096_003038, partial [Nowakowskiella sp. JEL0078]